MSMPSKRLTRGCLDRTWVSNQRVWKRRRA